jgi:hypothetical protein
VTGGRLFSHSGAQGSEEFVRVRSLHRDGHPVAAGTISTPVAATYGFDRVGEAITRAIQSGGKVLLTPNA